MIALLNGIVESINEGTLVVNVGGVGYRVRVSNSAREHAAIGRNIRLHTHLQARENEIALFGFSNEEELALFETLLGVSGIGPKVALNILGGAPPDRLRSAIANEEMELFTRVPGVGPKTAKALIFHLKDKMGALPGVTTPGLRFTSDDTEIIGALTELGYSIVEAQAALASVPADSAAGVEERLRLALAYFARPAGP
jgi:Holliday junction DNA helicase RuvA